MAVILMKTGLHRILGKFSKLLFYISLVKGWRKYNGRHMALWNSEIDLIMIRTR